jgi:DNA-binding response OmpR family regulator
MYMVLSNDAEGPHRRGRSPASVFLPHRPVDGGFRGPRGPRRIRGGRSIDHDPPDIVVLDLGLPGFSGRTVLQDLAAQAHTHHIPVVVVTGQTGLAIEQLDADCILAKPISADRLVATVQNCLASGAGDTER